MYNGRSAKKRQDFFFFCGPISWWCHAAALSMSYCQISLYLWVKLNSFDTFNHSDEHYSEVKIFGACTDDVC